MSQIPDNEVTAKDLADWFTKKVKLAKLKVDEMLLRKKIFRFYFPTPKEGTNNHTLPDGYVLSGGHVVERKIDEPVLLAMWDELIEAKINPNLLIKRTPELVKSAYNELTAEQKNLFDRCLIIKDGSPSLEIKPPAKAKGKAGEKVQ